MTRTADAACPDERALDEYAAQILRADLVEAIRRHVETCSTCRSTVEEYQSGIEFGQLLREARQDTDPALRRALIDSASALFPRDPS